MALKQRLYRPDAASPWYGELPVESLYTAGVAGDRFLRDLRDKGRFMATVCEECEEVYVPGKAFCPVCFSRLEKWVAVGPRGTLDSWTMLFVGLDGKPLKKPELVGLINLDGATTSIVHRLGGIEAEDLVIGLRVTAELKPKSKRKGSVTDILHFKPATRKK